MLGEQGYATLADVPFPIDVVDVFRRSEAAGEFADQAVAIGARGVWFQLGVIDEDAFARTTAAGVPMVMDTCPAIEWRQRARMNAPGRDLSVPPGPGLPDGLVVPAGRAGRAVLPVRPGPGGQSVNTTDSRVELEYDVASSTALTDAQRARALHSSAGRLIDGRLVVDRLRAPLAAPQPGGRPRTPGRPASHRPRSASADRAGRRADPRRPSGAGSTPRSSAARPRPCAAGSAASEPG